MIALLYCLHLLLGAAVLGYVSRKAGEPWFNSEPCFWGYIAVLVVLTVWPAIFVRVAYESYRDRRKGK
jgi:uncharacterized membrane protein